MKLWGMALIVLSGLLAGLLTASRLKRRVRLLLDLKALLQGFSTGIRFCSGSLSELIVEHQESPFCRQAEREPEFPEEPAAALEQAGDTGLQLIRQRPHTLHTLLKVDFSHLPGKSHQIERTFE